MIFFAKYFAKWAHRNQVRKYTGDPYFVHCERVAGYVRMVPHTRAMIMAAYLHDVVEDTGFSLEFIRFFFGRSVAYLVDGLTDVSKKTDGNRAERKALDRDHTASFDHRVHTIKLADLIDNGDSIMKHDPNFAKIYMAEKEELLKVLTQGDWQLHQLARIIVEDYKKARDDV